ncbi:MAG: hypothetical protein HYU59_09135 [Magnetospirillum gryphiswaldense]|nr:hypothetical protein [Magnetospirillum gryphiswaldense]
MELPVDQHLLYSDLTAKLDKLGNQDQLIAYMGQVLRTLLRRQGDSEFRVAIQDSFISGLMGRDWDDQLALAREVILIVIAKRPEIALAWQRQQGGDDNPHRRAADRGEAPKVVADPDLPDLDLIGAPPPRPTPPKPPYSFSAAEDKVTEHVIETLTRRLSLFRLPTSAFPSIAYVHEQEFFLFSPIFARVAGEFMAQVILPSCRDSLERRVYKAMSKVAATRPDMGLSEVKSDMWAVVVERLGKLGGRLNGARSKLAMPADAGEPKFQEVEVPVDRPRVFRVLGVGFRMGTRTELKRVKVKVKSAKELDQYEIEALNLMSQLRDRTAEAGLDLPQSCDFEFLAALFMVDGRRLAQTVKELLALAEHKETSRAYLMERLGAVDETFANTLSDAIALLLFHGAVGGPFGFAELYETAIGTARDQAVRAMQRPFLTTELARRPRELAFQVREVMRKRLDEMRMTTALAALFNVWNNLPQAQFAQSRDAALTVFRAFPIAFAGDADETALSAIGQQLCAILAAEKVDGEMAAAAILRLYKPLAQAVPMAPGAFVV